MQPLTHFGSNGEARMVDVGGKSITARQARASATIRLRPDTLSLILSHTSAKGDVLAVARVAGIQAAKKTPDLIPLCHALPVDGVTIEFAAVSEDTLRVESEVRCQARTGVEMEALTAAAVAALTVYDMVKSVDRSLTIDHLQIEEKSGGRSGRFQRGNPT